MPTDMKQIKNMNKNKYRHITVKTVGRTAGMVFTLALVGTGALLSSCHDDDRFTAGITCDDTEAVENVQRPTNDQLGTKYSKTAIVFGGDRTDFNASVVNRMDNQTNEVNAGVQAFVFTKGCNVSLSESEALSMVRAFRNDANFVFVHPESFSAEAVATSLEEAAATLEEQDFDTEGIDQFIGRIRNLRTRTDAEAVALRREAVYVIPKLEAQADSTARNTTAYATDGDGNVLQLECPFVDYQPTAYDYGQAADKLVDWMKNEKTDDGSNTGSGNINDLIASDPVTFNFVLGPSRALDKTMHYSMTYQIYPIHDFDHNRDYYFVRLGTNLHASELDCIKDQPSVWVRANKVVTFDDGATSGKIFSARSNLWYGPYVSKMDIAAMVEQTDRQEKISVEQAMPQTDVSGTSGITSGFSYSLTGNLGLNAQGPKKEGDSWTTSGDGGLVGSVVISESKTHSESDLMVYHSDYGGNYTAWNFYGITPVFVNKFWTGKHEHTEVANWQVNDWQNELTWVFIVDNPKEEHEYKLKVEQIVEMKELNHSGYNLELAVRSKQTSTVTMPMPNRFCDNFTMSCSDNTLQEILNARLSNWKSELVYYGHTRDEVLQGAKNFFKNDVKKAIIGLELSEFKGSGTYTFRLRKLGSADDLVTFSLEVKDGKASVIQ